MNKRLKTLLFVVFIILCFYIIIQWFNFPTYCSYNGEKYPGERTICKSIYKQIDFQKGIFGIMPFIIINGIILYFLLQKKQKQDDKKGEVFFKKQKILIAEDEDVLREMYMAEFKKAGFEVFGAANGEEAYEIAIKAQPDIITTDIVMPLVDGFAAAKKIKNDQKTKHIPVFGLANLAQQSDYDDAKSIGMNDYIVNFTITPSQLVKQIQEFFKDPKSYKPIFGKHE